MAVAFFNGLKMPLVGLGTWQATNPEELETALDVALSLGYRHIDTAYMYLNEEIIGRVLKRWLDSGKVKREELFIVTKLPPIGARPEHVNYFLEKQLQSLQLEYVDLYLVHTPLGFQYRDDSTLFPMDDDKIALDLETNHAEIWKAMEEQVDKGRTKSIGISNFSSGQIEKLMKTVRIPPANHQVELHAYCQQKPLRETCKKYNITMCAYAPIGSPGRKELYKERAGIDWEPLPLLEDPVVVEIAEAHGKSTSQVLLRFLTQQNIVVIPKSTNPERIKSNFEIQDFTLSESEMDKLFALDKAADGKTFDFTKSFKGVTEHPECVTTYG